MTEQGFTKEDALPGVGQPPGAVSFAVANPEVPSPDQQSPCSCAAALDALAQWRFAEQTADTQELENARLSRDLVLGRG